MRTLLAIIFNLLGTIAQFVTLVSGVVALILLVRYMGWSNGSSADFEVAGWSGLMCIGACLVIIMSDSIVEKLQGR